MRSFPLRLKLRCMTAKLDGLRQAFCELHDEGLIALRHASIDTRHLAPSFTAWIKHAVDWELDRRSGSHYSLLIPEELVHPQEFVRGAKRTLSEMAARLASTQAVLDTLRELVSQYERP